jgi:hypothetical protein
MTKKFQIAIRESLLKTGLSAASEVPLSAELLRFCDSISIWELGNLRIKFIKDRGQEFVDVGSKFDASHFFIFGDISLLMKWQSLEEIIHADAPLDLESSLSLIKRDLDKLEVLFSKSMLQETSNKISLISEEKTRAKFG